MKRIDLEPGSQEWLEFRRKGIGASESSIILGINPWQTKLQLWKSKIEAKDQPLNPAMKRGMEREEEARKFCEQHFGAALETGLFVHEMYNWKFCTLDGYNKDLGIVIEIKWANRKVHELARLGKVIDYYYSQCQSQMEVMEVDSMYFVSCFQSTDVNVEYIIVEVKKDPEYINVLLKEEIDFYLDHLSVKIPPPPTKEDKVALMDTEELMMEYLCEQYVRNNEMIAELQDKNKQLYKMISDCEYDKFETKSYSICKYDVKGQVDYSLIPELKDIDLEQYRKEGRTQWKITRKK